MGIRFLQVYTLYVNRFEAACFEGSSWGLRHGMHKAVYKNIIYLFIYLFNINSPLITQNGENVQKTYLN